VSAKLISKPSMVHCQRLHQEDSTEVSLGLILFIASELDDRRH